MLIRVTRNGIQLWEKNHIGDTDMEQDTAALVDYDDVELIGKSKRKDDDHGRQHRAEGKDQLETHGKRRV